MGSKSSHANRGRAWEKTLEMFHRRYESTRLAVVVRTPPPVRILRAVKPGQFLAVYEKQGPPDYILIADGVAVMAEAKHTASKRWPLANVHAHQAERLDGWLREGGASVVLLHHSSSGSSWVLMWDRLAPLWREWRDAKRRGTTRPGQASLTLSQLDALGARFERDGYLSTVLRLHRSTSDKQ